MKGRHSSQKGERVGRVHRRETKFTERRQNSQRGDRVHRGETEFTEGRHIEETEL